MQGTMVTRKVGVLFFCALALSVLMMEGAGGRLGRNRAFLGLMNSFSAAAYLSGGEDEILLNCIIELMDLREVLKLSGSFPVYGMDSDRTKTSSLSECGKLNVVASLTPAVKYIFVKCLIAKGFRPGISRHDHILSKIYSECLDHPVLRRHLADQSLHSSGPVLAPVPGPAPASAPASMPSPRAPVQPPTPTVPPSHPAPGSSPSPDQHFPTFPSGLSPSEADGRTPESAPILSDEEQNKKKSVIVAAVLSSAGTFLLLACVLCCYKKCFRRRNNLSYGRDESPLLNLRMSDFSGSSNKSFGSASSIHMGPLSSKVDSARNSHAIAMDYSDGASLSDIISGYSNAPNVVPFKSVNGLEQKVPLPPPPGMPARTALAPPSTTIVNPPVPAPVPSPPQLTSQPPAPPPPPPPIASSVNKASPAPPAPPPPIPVRKSGPQTPLPPGPRPPPPPGPRPPPPPTAHPPKGNSKPKRPSSLGENHLGNSVAESDSSASKTKLKPFFWDKVLANPDQSMVWHQIKSGSFQFDEEMIETLFGYNASVQSNGENKKESSFNDSSVQYIQLLDPKKSQNLAISLKALNVKTEDVCNALMEGEELPTELLQTLLRMQPTTDEELKIRLYTGDLSLLGPAEQFLKSLMDIPYVFKRMDVLLFMSSLYEDVTSTKESFATLEEACTELRSNRLFLKLLEAVLKTGNRMNNGTFRGGAQAFKLDTLLKLSDVKGSDGKTTLLHFVVQEIIRSEGVRAARLARESRSTSGLSSYSFNSDDFPDDSPKETEDDYHSLGLKVVSGLSNELEHVKKAAGIDIDALISAVASFGHRLVNITEFLNKDMKNLGEDSGFHHSLKCFVEHAEAAITFLLEEEKRIKTLVHKTTDYFHGNAGKDEGLRLFIIVRNFLGMLDKACKEVRESQKKVSNPAKVKSNSNAPSIPDPRQLLFPAIKDRRMDNSSSDEE